MTLYNPHPFLLLYLAMSAKFSCLTLPSPDHVSNFLAHYFDVCNTHLAQALFVYIFQYIFPLRKNFILLIRRTKVRLPELA